MKWENVPLDEQETIVNIDYYEKTINVYTSRKTVGERLIKKMGTPTRIFENGGYVQAIEYKRSLFDKDTTKFFSKMLLVGMYRKQDDENKKE